MNSKNKTMRNKLRIIFLKRLKRKKVRDSSFKSLGEMSFLVIYEKMMKKIRKANELKVKSECYKRGGAGRIMKKCEMG